MKNIENNFKLRYTRVLENRERGIKVIKQYEYYFYCHISERLDITLEHFQVHYFFIPSLRAKRENFGNSHKMTDTR